MISSRSANEDEQLSPFLNGLISDMTLPDDLAHALEHLQDDSEAVDDQPVRSFSSVRLPRVSFPLQEPEFKSIPAPQRQSFHEELEAIRSAIQELFENHVHPVESSKIYSAEIFCDKPIYHITHIGNLPPIIEAGCLLSDREIQRQPCQPTRIGYSHLKESRLSKYIEGRLKYAVGDYVPFYFAPRSPMLYAIHTNSVAGYQGGQRPIIHLVSNVNLAVRSGQHWLFADGNAIASESRFFDDLRFLDQVDWDVMTARYWDGRERKRRRQAEFLTLRMFPWKSITSIGVHDEEIGDRVRLILAQYGYRPEVIIRRDWYY